MWGELDRTREALPEVLEAIERLLSEQPRLSVHYVGYAHEPVLRLLHRYLGKEFSVMDMPDRYYTGVAFWGEYLESDPPPQRPEWLWGVPFYQEGAPETVDLWIEDTLCSDLGRVAAVLERRRPKFCLLADEARFVTLHPDYAWSTFPTYVLGIRT